jgi:alpha-D-xyloside xylohydrolase
MFSCSGKQVETLQNGVIVHLTEAATGKAKTVRVQVISDKIIRVTATPENKLPDVKSLMSIINPDKLKSNFEVTSDSNQVSIKTKALKAIVSLKTGEVEFTDSTGKTILAEKKGGKNFYPIDIEGKKMYSVRQEFETTSDEALYGLGENQNGIANIKGKDLDLTQVNTIAVVPFLVSTKGYGILWDNNSRTKFGDPRDYKQLSSLKLYDANNKEGGLTAVYSYLENKEKPVVTRIEKEIDYNYIPDLKKLPEGIKLGKAIVTWSGSIESDTTGLHKFIWFAAGYSKIWLDGHLVADKWRQAWNGNTTKLYLQMEKGKKYPVKIEWIPDGGESYAAMKCLTPLPQSEQEEISLLSEAGQQIDYYFMYGADMDDAISGYRTVTGKANLMPKWAMGFWQSRERYKTQDELLGVAREYRKRNIPIDNIVQDWFYWKEDKWGEQEFDSERFPEPKAMLKELHDSNYHMMISVWPKLYVSTKNYEYMNSKGWVYKRNVENKQKDWVGPGYVSTFYDAYNPQAREYFWDQMNKKLFSIGIDAWWLDASEPDILSNASPADRKLLMGPTYLGSSTEYFNSYSLVNAMCVYEGQTKASPNQRAFILTRSAFAGIQRYSSATWSGDIGVRWHDMKDQIACGINFSMSGTPYWAMDIGGFAVENRYYNLKDKKNLDEWQEIMTRWFQFGTFCPIYRAHGQFPFREIYNIAGDNKTVYDALVSCNLMRYRLMPYIYSLAGQTYHNDYTIMRSLAMDFTADKATYDINDQFMFGPSILVNPVTDYKARNRNLYLPAGTGWYDLYTGKYNEGGKTINYSAPIDNIPVFVKEGSIIPTGPDIQYAMEKSDPITLFIYSGKDGSFFLYEDEGTTNNYEKGDFSIIPIRYYEGIKTLVIGAREGKFAGMEDRRTIQIVVVDKNNPVSLAGKIKPSQTVKYKGEELSIKL